MREFPSGPVVRTQSFHRQGPETNTKLCSIDTIKKKKRCVCEFP